MSKQFDKNKHQGKGPRARRSRSRREEIRDKEEEYKDEKGNSYPLNNHPSWYFDDPTLASQVSRFSFNQFIGQSNLFTGSSINWDVPVTMQLFFNPSPGFNSPNDPGFSGINQAGIKLYTALTSGNAKNAQYAPQDVTTLMLALGEVLSMSEMLRRALGLAFTYNKRNWAYARDIIAAAGVEPESMLANLAKYRLLFNTTVNEINKIAFPATIKYFEKCVYMYSHVWLDSESPMSQTYIYLPMSTWELDENTYEGGTILKTKMIWNGDVPREFEDLLAILRGMIDNILESATFNYIYADVLRLFGDGGLYTVPFITEDYVVVPEYDPLALLQINNATSIGVPNGTQFVATGDSPQTPANDVYPMPVPAGGGRGNRLIYCPQWNNVSSPFDKGVILNFPHSMGDPDETQRIESTRFVSMITNHDGTDVTDGAALPDHYLCSVIIKGPGDATIIAFDATYYDMVSEPTADEMIQFASTFAVFDDAPRLYCGYRGSITNVLGDLDFFTTIDYEYLTNVNKLAYATLFT